MSGDEGLRHEVALKATSELLMITPTFVVFEPYFTPSLVVLFSMMLPSSFILHPPTLGIVGKPHPKWVQVFIAPSLEPPLITSLLDVPPLSQSLDMLHTKVMSSACLFDPSTL